MQERTAFRLAMLANGYWPLLNDCKKAIETGWPTRRVNETEILSWDRSALASTGLKIDGDLAVIDVDVSETVLVEELAGALEKKFPELFMRGLVRHAGGPKEAWIARVDEPFRRLASRRWYRGGDPDDPAVSKHIWLNVSARSGRDSSGSTARTSVTRQARSSASIASLAAPPRRRRRGRPCQYCRRRPTQLPAIGLMTLPRRRGSPRLRRPAAAQARRRSNVLSLMRTPRSRRKTTVR
jgi:hypothetical protein